MEEAEVLLDALFEDAEVDEALYDRILCQVVDDLIARGELEPTSDRHGPR